MINTELYIMSMILRYKISLFLLTFLVITPFQKLQDYLTAHTHRKVIVGYCSIFTGLLFLSESHKKHLSLVVRIAHI